MADNEKLVNFSGKFGDVGYEIHTHPFAGIMFKGYLMTYKKSGDVIFFIFEIFRPKYRISRTTARY